MEVICHCVGTESDLGFGVLNSGIPDDHMTNRHFFFKYKGSPVRISAL